MVYFNPTSQLHGFYGLDTPEPEFHKNALNLFNDFRDIRINEEQLTEGCTTILKEASKEEPNFEALSTLTHLLQQEYGADTVKGALKVYDLDTAFLEVIASYLTSTFEAECTEEISTLFQWVSELHQFAYDFLNNQESYTKTYRLHWKLIHSILDNLTSRSSNKLPLFSSIEPKLFTLLLESNVKDITKFEAMLSAQLQPLSHTQIDYQSIRENFKANICFAKDGSITMHLCIQACCKAGYLPLYPLPGQISLQLIIGDFREALAILELDDVDRAAWTDIFSANYLSSIKDRATDLIAKQLCYELNPEKLQLYIEELSALLALFLTDGTSTAFIAGASLEKLSQNECIHLDNFNLLQEYAQSQPW